jgi:hypothetical protein
MMIAPKALTKYYATNKGATNAVNIWSHHIHTLYNAKNCYLHSVNYLTDPTGSPAMQLVYSSAATTMITDPWLTPTSSTSYFGVHDDWDSWDGVEDAVQINRHDGVHEYTTRKGYRIRILADGDYEISAPEKLDLLDHVKLHPNANLLGPDGRVLEVNKDGTLKRDLLLNVSDNVIDLHNPSAQIKDAIGFQSFGKIAVPAGGTTLILPNEVKVKVDANGTTTIDTSDQKVIYDFAPRGFNRFLNASDVLEDFIRYLATQDVRQRHVMKLPLGLFIHWLIIAAAEADGDPAEDLKPNLHTGVAKVKAQPRCKFCQRFLAAARADKGIAFCSGAHMDRYMDREGLLALPARRARRVPVPRIAPPSESYFRAA